MPVTPTYPGVYIEEVPSGVRTIAGVSTSITAFVGSAPNGPLDAATRVLSQGDYDRQFGGLHRDSAMSYAVRQFFGNGGTDAYIVRTASGAAPAAVTLGSAAGPVLTVTSANAGAWGNQLRIDVDHATANPDSTFNLTVSRIEDQGGRKVTTAVENHRNLSMSSISATYAPATVNAASRLIHLERVAGLTFGHGLSRSGTLQGLALTEADRRIEGVLDNDRAFTLELVGTLPTDVAGLVTALTAAIAAAGLGTALSVERTDALGTAAAGGNFVQLVSSATTDASSVRITAAGRNTRLGVANGGRDIEGAAATRPSPNGTTSGDLADVIGTDITLPAVRIQVDDLSTGSGTTVLAATALAPLATTRVGPALAAALQSAIQAVDHPATAGARVDLVGTRLRVLTSAATPNATITFVAGGAATGLRTSTAAGGVVNLQGYSVGVGPTAANQSGATVGSDGSPPDGTALIGSAVGKTGMQALLDVDLFNILCIPGTPDLAADQATAVISAGLALCQARRAFYIVDVDKTRVLSDVGDWVDTLDKSTNGAVYFPRLNIADPLDNFRVRDMSASGAVAGVYARTDAQRGVWKAPAGTGADLRGTQGVKLPLTDGENGLINPRGINALRTMPPYGTLVWGARTLQGADAQASEWKYVPIRRLALFLEESLYRGTKWVVFEENDEPLWAQIRLNVGAFLQRLFLQGAFQGASPQAAYFVKCDGETTTATDRNLGVVNILVGFAPLKPAEFVVLQIQQIADQAAA